MLVREAFRFDVDGGRLAVDFPALRDLFNGAERLMSVNSIPTSKRRVSSRSEAGADGAA